jgi:hypothetical protein
MPSSSRRFAFAVAAALAVVPAAVPQDAATTPAPETAAATASAAPPATTPTPPAEPATAATAPTAAAPEEPKPAPQLVAEAPIQDLGRIQKGERAEVEFVLANRGDAALKIKSVQPACGCTVASFDADVEPGATGRVRATLDTSTLAGSVAKSITVLSNDPKTPRLTLTIRAEIVAFIELSPGFARLMQVQTMPQQVAVVHLWSGDGTPFELLEVRTPQPWITSSLRRAEASELKPGAPAEQWRLEVAVSAEAPLGPLTDKLVVRTSHPRQPELEVPLSGFVRPVLQATPAAADFGALGPAARDKSRFVLKLFNFGADAIEIQGATTDLEFLTVTSSAEEKGRRFRIELRLAPEAPKGKFEGTLRIETTSATMPVVEVPVRGKVG